MNTFIEMTAREFKADAGKVEDTILDRIKRKYGVTQLQVEDGNRADILQKALQSALDKQSQDQTFIGFRSYATSKWQGKLHRITLTFTP